MNNNGKNPNVTQALSPAGSNNGNNGNSNVQRDTVAVLQHLSRLDVLYLVCGALVVALCFTVCVLCCFCTVVTRDRKINDEEQRSLEKHRRKYSRNSGRKRHRKSSSRTSHRSASHRSHRTGSHSHSHRSGHGNRPKKYGYFLGRNHHHHQHEAIPSGTNSVLYTHPPMMPFHQHGHSGAIHLPPDVVIPPMYTPTTRSHHGSDASNAASDEDDRDTINNGNHHGSHRGDDDENMDHREEEEDVIDDLEPGSFSNRKRRSRGFSRRSSNTSNRTFKRHASLHRHRSNWSNPSNITGILEESEHTERTEETEELLEEGKSLKTGAVIDVDQHHRGDTTFDFEAAHALPVARLSVHHLGLLNNPVLRELCEMSPSNSGGMSGRYRLNQHKGSAESNQSMPDNSNAASISNYATPSPPTLSPSAEREEKRDRFPLSENNEVGHSKTISMWEEVQRKQQLLEQQKQEAAIANGGRKRRRKDTNGLSGGSAGSSVDSAHSANSGKLANSASSASTAVFGSGAGIGGGNPSELAGISISLWTDSNEQDKDDDADSTKGTKDSKFTIVINDKKRKRDLKNRYNPSVHRSNILNARNVSSAAEQRRDKSESDEVAKSSKSSNETEVDEETDVESTQDADDVNDDSMESNESDDSIGSIPVNVTLDQETARKLTELRDHDVFSNPTSPEVQAVLQEDESGGNMKAQVETMWEKVRKSTLKSNASNKSYKTRTQSSHGDHEDGTPFQKQRTLTYSSDNGGNIINRQIKSISAWSGGSHETMLRMDRENDDVFEMDEYGMDVDVTLDAETSEVLTALKNTNRLMALAGVSRSVHAGKGKETDSEAEEDDDDDGLTVRSNLLQNEQR